MAHYFPQGIAIDSAFCNREKERAKLKNYMAQHEHVVIVAPRRYGKTSLIMKVLEESRLPGISMDLFFVLTQEEVTKIIKEGVEKIISALLPKTQAACQKIINSMSVLNPKLSFNFLGNKLEITTKQVTEKSISELLLALDQIAEKTKHSCVLVFDEFQQIAELKENHAIEAAIRHAVERSKRVSYVFCGSKRHLLSEMFSNKSRPLYHLCDLMTLDRISFSSYKEFLNARAKAQWKKMLDDDVVEEILHLTENHPYYINTLCRHLWRNDKPPMLSNVRNVWDAYVDQQALWIANDLSNLTLNRKRVMTALAHQPTSQPQGKEFLDRVGITPAGVKRVLEDLQKVDVIYLDSDKNYRILDPAMAYFIRKNANRN